MRRLVSAFLLGVLGAAVLAAQSPPADFRSAVRAVLVDFAVVDGQGHFVPDLTADDVVVEEDGRAQAISAFSLVTIPVEEAAHMSGVAGDRSAGSNADNQGRLFVLVLDDVRLHPLRVSTAKAIARQFVERHLGPRDRAAFITISGKAGTAQFTGDRAALMTQIGTTKSRDQDFYSMAPAVRSFRYLENIVDRLAAIGGRRKSLILITEGIYADVKLLPQVSPPRPVIADDGPDDAVEEPALASRPTAFDFTGTLTSDAIAARALVEAAARAHVAIYAIDPRGQPGGAWDSIRPGRLAPDEAPGWDNFAFAQDVMSALAAETGGSALTNSNDFTGAFNRVVRDASAYYLLAYAPSQTKTPGFRSIRVTTKRPGLQVHARQGYTDRERDPETPRHLLKGWTPALYALMNSPVETPGLALRIGAAAFRARSDSDASLAVAIHIRGSDLRLDSEDLAGLDFVVGAIDARGELRREWHAELGAQVRQLTRESVERDGVRFVTTLDVNPGHYVVRVAGVARGGSMDRRGSAQVEIDVPEFSSRGLGMSGIGLVSHDEMSRPSIWIDNAAVPPFARSMTAMRVFSGADELTVFARMYPMERRAARVDVRALVQAADGHIVLDNRSSLLDSDARKSAEFAYALTIPLGELAPGEYTLTLTAQEIGQPSAIRRIAFVAGNP